MWKNNCRFSGNWSLESLRGKSWPTELYFRFGDLSVTLGRNSLKKIFGYPRFFWCITYHWVEAMWYVIQGPGPPLACCVILSKLLPLSGPEGEACDFVVLFSTCSPLTNSTVLPLGMSKKSSTLALHVLEVPIFSLTAMLLSTRQGDMAETHASFSGPHQLCGPPWIHCQAYIYLFLVQPPRCRPGLELWPSICCLQAVWTERWTFRLGAHMYEWEALQDTGESGDGAEAVCMLVRGWSWVHSPYVARIPKHLGILSSNLTLQAVMKLYLSS